MMMLVLVVVAAAAVVVVMTTTMMQQVHRSARVPAGTPRCRCLCPLQSRWVTAPNP